MLTGKWLAPTAAIATGACVVFVLVRADTPAAGQVAARMWGATSLGAVIPWPAGSNAGGTVPARPQYSPSGRALAFIDAKKGQPMILELAAAELHRLYDLTGRDRPNLQCIQFAWLSDDRLCLLENWLTEDDYRELLERVEDPNLVLFLRQATRSRYRVIDWVARRVVFERDISTQQLTEFNLIGGYSENLWIVSRRPSDPNWHWWVYDPATQEFVKPLVPRVRKGDWIPCGPTGPWVVKWLLPYPEPVNMWNVPYDVEFVNYETGGTRRLSAVPYQVPNGLFITGDGRYVVASFLSEAERRWAPVVFDTLTGRRHELPSTESWKPEALSDSRGVLLVRVLNQEPDKSWAEDLVEIPLSQLLPQ